MAELTSDGGLGPEAQAQSLPLPPDPNAEAPVSGPGSGSLLQSLPMSEEDVTMWWEEVEAARQRIRQKEREWDTLLKEYIAVVKGYNEPENIKVNAHFRNVHTKLPKLFVRQPDLVLSANGPLTEPVIDPMSGMPMINPGTLQPITGEDVAIIKQEVLRKKLGREPAGINVVRLMDELLFDVLAWTGIAGSKIGYRAVVQQVPQPVTDPMTMQPVVDPMTGQPQTQMVPVVLWEEWYWDRIAPKKLLVPVRLASTRHDKDADWLGMEFTMTEGDARKTFQIPENVEIPLQDEDDRLYQHQDVGKQDSPKRKLVRGVELFIKASKYDRTVLNPLQIRQLVLIDGIKDKAILYRDDPDQSFDEMGIITPDSRIGFPIHILTLRDLADSAFPQSDAAFTNSQAKHLNTHRQQSSKLRDANIGKFLFDEGAFSADEVKALQTSDVGAWHGVQPGRLRDGVDKIVAQVTQANQSRDDYRIAALIKDDMDETLGLPKTEAGVVGDEDTSATAVATASSKAADRLKKEQDRTLDYYLTGVHKFDALLMRYADATDYVQIVGQDGLRRLVAYNRQTIAGPFAYDAKPDSQLNIDAARDRSQLLAFYQAVGQDPLVDRRVIVKKLAQLFGLDPSKILLDPMMAMMMGGPQGPGGSPPGGGPGAGPGGGPGGDGNTGRVPNAPVPGVGTTQVQNATGRG